MLIIGGVELNPGPQNGRISDWLCGGTKRGDERYMSVVRKEQIKFGYNEH